ncbi:DUF551 domain-containing protein [Raoultella ornithinolytica]|uniref:DUF551 domain-containing protein n=1 Tax=Raoultella ornithinolytica TaxID=54291 RepID=UPI0015DC4613|nr:DUF551 domain-containing protein [Raoultella ornithinolytica]QLK17860.1 DUF551 domain-containing protein [Raoultella ornithinolytica]
MTSKLTSEILDDETLAELIAFRRSRVEYCQKEGLPYQKALHDSMMLALEELQERRKVERDTEPYGFTDGDRRGMIYEPQYADRLKEPLPVYRHAQPAPVVQENRAITKHFDTMALETAREILCDVNRRHEFPGGEFQFLSRIQCRIDEACRAAMLQAGTLTNEGTKQAGNSPVIPCAEQRIADAVELLKQAAPAMLADNGGPNGPLVGRLKSPVIPDGYRLQPISEYEAMCATVNSDEWPQRWIPVSERMPEDRTQVILWDAEIGEVTSGHYSHKTHTFYHCGDAIQNEITHRMPLPAAPQEVKGE